MAGSIRLDHKRVAEGRRQSRGPWSPMKVIDLSSFPPWERPAGLTRAFRNNRYIVQVHDYAETTVGYAIRAMIQSLTGEPVRNWEDLQRVKNECFGAETVAIEYYPAQSDLRNAHNIYWLWIYEPGQIPMPILGVKD
jgi:hypothetical protein